MDGIESIADADVDSALDRELRTLLASCFTGPDDQIFRVRRFAREAPAWRWWRRSDDGGLIAHVAVHDKHLGHASGDRRVAGVAEVCVRADQRGRGLARDLLSRVHADCAARGFGWGALFGEPGVYAAAGYVVAGNPLRLFNPGIDKWYVTSVPGFQVARLRADAPPWPAGEIDLRGPLF